MQGEIKEEALKRVLEGMAYISSALELILEQYEIQNIEELEKEEY